MIHLRIVVPTPKSERVVDLLEATPSVSSLARFAGAALDPKGDVILCDVAREDASVVIDDLRELGVPREGSISIEEIDSQLSAAAERAERAAGGLAGDAVVWEEVEARTSEATELNANFLAFIVLACLIASVGLMLGQPILIVGAMVVGPEFGPLAGLCVAVVQRRKEVALRSLTALAVGFPCGITAAYLFGQLTKATGLVDAGLQADRERTDLLRLQPQQVLLHRRALRRHRRHALADVGQVGRPGRGADLGDDDPRRGRDRRRRRLRRLALLEGLDGAAGDQPGRDPDRRSADAAAPEPRLPASPQPPSRRLLPRRRRPLDRTAPAVIRQLAIMLGAFVLGAAVAAALGAVSFGVALGVGQVCFAAALVWVLLS